MLHWPIRLRSLWVILILLSLLPQPAAALRLTWTGGAKMLNTSATRCTLIVTANDPAASLPKDWHLVWSVSGGTNGRVTIVSIPDSPQAGDVCGITPGSSRAGIASHADTVRHCNLQSGADGVQATYVLQIDAGLNGTFRVLEPADSLMLEGTRADVIGLNEAVLGPSRGQRLPAILRAAALYRSGGRIVFVASGWNLDQANAAVYRRRDGRPFCALQVKPINASRVLAEGVTGRLVPDGYLELRSREGSIATIAVEQEPDTSRTDFARDRLIVRFRRGALEMPVRDRSIELAACTIRDPNLRNTLYASRVLSVRAALPSFSRDSLHCRNVLGQEVMLDDLTDLCVLQIDPAIDPRVARRQISELKEVLYVDLGLLSTFRGRSCLS